MLTGGFAIGRPDEIKGEAITLFVVVKDGLAADYDLTDEIVKIVEDSRGRFARPEEVRVASELPKTRTGKLVKRLVRAKIAGESIQSQDLSIIENPWSLDAI